MPIIKIWIANHTEYILSQYKSAKLFSLLRFVGSIEQHAKTRQLRYRKLD